MSPKCPRMAKTIREHGAVYSANIRRLNHDTATGARGGIFIPTPAASLTGLHPPPHSEHPTLPTLYPSPVARGFIATMESQDMFATELEERTTLCMVDEGDLCPLQPASGEGDNQLTQPTARQPPRGTEARGDARAGTTRAKKRPPPTAHEEDNEDDDEDEDEASQVLQTRRKKPTRAPLDKVSAEDEQEAMEWYRDHPELYAKKSARYLDTSYKARIIRAKADDMGIQREYICVVHICSSDTVQYIVMLCRPSCDIALVIFVPIVPLASIICG